MATVTQTAKPKTAKPMQHYMLHIDPEDFPDRALFRCGRYKASEPRAAALKAATKMRTREDMKGSKHLVMRAMGTKVCSRFEWSTKELENPRVVSKKDKDNNDRAVQYRFAPRVKLVGKFIMDSEPDDEETAE